MRAAGSLDDCYCGIVYVRGHDVSGTRKYVDHVSLVLADAHHPIRVAGARIITAEGSGWSCRKPDLALHKGWSMRAT